jgi:hypothetical protein
MTTSQWFVFGFLACIVILYFYTSDRVNSNNEESNLESIERNNQENI